MESVVPKCAQLTCMMRLGMTHRVFEGVSVWEREKEKEIIRMD